MKKSELLQALQTEIRRHDFSTFLTEKPSMANGGTGVVVPGCPAHYRLEKRPDLHTGNLLHLLNHAAGHSMPAEEREAARREGIEKGREKMRKVNAVLNSWMRSQL